MPQIPSFSKARGSRDRLELANPNAQRGVCFLRLVEAKHRNVRTLCTGSSKNRFLETYAPDWLSGIYRMLRIPDDLFCCLLQSGKFPCVSRLRRDLRIWRGRVFADEPKQVTNQKMLPEFGTQRIRRLPISGP